MKAQVATAALAVALVTSAAPVLAQDAGVVPPPAVTTVTPPPAPQSVAPPPVVHTLPVTSGADSASAASVPVAPDAAAQASQEGAARAKAAPAAKAAPKPAADAPTPAPLAKAAPRPDPALPAASAPDQPAPLPPLSQSAPPPAAQPAPPPAMVQPDAPVEANGWWIGLGLAAAAAALALIAYFARRRPVAAQGAPATFRAPEPMPVAPKASASADAELKPVTAPTLAEREHEVVIAPVMTGQGRAPGRHAVAALRGPTPDNPFLTRRARLRRARFYDRRERLAAEVGRPTPFATRQTDAERVADAAPAPRRTPLTGGWSGGFRPAFGES